ncbi:MULTISPECIES: hypothetical protein [Priestia]|uniref:hypothetical protein n=1 Tax=Priestia TaxID=2800373 RepID=UPI000BF5B0A2|nr:MULTISPECIES: hypothetical protein [Priestia]MCM3253572.1 hypothetical protein [Priestia aryabhattai]MCM3640676.1 hypothetical protein [Priestia aryabhattai]PFW80112.1 hypothetical protein COL23_00410 [Priestia aryabhattai]
MLVKGRIRTVNRSDLFIVMINVNVGFMYIVGFYLWIEGQEEDSCGTSGRDETPQERKRSLACKSTAL